MKKRKSRHQNSKGKNVWETNEAQFSEEARKTDNPLTKLIKKEDLNSHYQGMKMDITCP